MHESGSILNTNKRYFWEMKALLKFSNGADF